MTWVYDGTSFTPVAKVAGGERYTIVQDYLGTPTQAYDSRGELVWEMLLDVYGNAKEYTGEKCFIPFRYQGQYEDEVTGLYYNRFRYYSPQMGMYISSDPIGLEGNNPTLYGYVEDTNIWLDEFGLNTSPSLPSKVVAVDGKTQIVHYYHNELEHAEPIHFHIEENGKSIGKIKADGTLLDGKHTKTSQRLAQETRNKLRKAEKKIAKYLKQVRIIVAGKPFRPGNRSCK